MERSARSAGLDIERVERHELMVRSRR